MCIAMLWSHVTTNKPTPLLLPNQQCQNTEGKFPVSTEMMGCQVTAFVLINHCHYLGLLSPAIFLSECQ